MHGRRCSWAQTLSPQAPGAFGRSVCWHPPSPLPASAAPCRPLRPALIVHTPFSSAHSSHPQRLTHSPACRPPLPLPWPAPTPAHPLASPSVQLPVAGPLATPLIAHTPLWLGVLAHDVNNVGGVVLEDGQEVDEGDHGPVWGGGRVERVDCTRGSQAAATGMARRKPFSPQSCSPHS